MTNSPEPGFLSDHSAHASEHSTWRWRLEDASGAEVVEVADFATATKPRFPSQSDAESWVGEVWRDLAEGGVRGVTLFDGDREIYGPMSLES